MKRCHVCQCANEYRECSRETTKRIQLEEDNNENEESTEAEAEQRNVNREIIKVRVKGGSLV